MENVNTQEIDLKEILNIIKNNKLLIIFFTFLFVIGAYVLLYFTIPQYKTYGTVEISSGKSAQANDQLIQALNLYSGPNNLQTEIQILKSRNMLIKALDKVNFTKRFYIKKHFKTTEIADFDFPFDVVITPDIKAQIVIVPLETNKALITINTKKGKIQKEIAYNTTYEINGYKFIVNKIKSPNLDAKYIVNFLDKISVAESLKYKLNISPLAPKASIIKVEFSDNLPKRAADFVNTLMKVYITQSIKAKTKQLDQTLNFIDNQLKIVSKKLAESEIALENYKKKHKVVDLGIEAQNILQKLNDLQTQLNELILKENLIEFIEEKIKDSKTTSLVSANILEDKVLADLITQLQQLLLKRQDLLIEYTIKHPDVIKTNEQIRTVKQMIINRIQNIKEMLLSKRKMLENMIDKYNKMLEALPQNERKLVNLQRTYQVNEKIYSYLLEKRAATALAKSSIVSDNRIIDTALEPSYPYKPKKKTVLLIGLVLGLIVGISVAFIKEYLNTKISSIEDIKKVTDVPIVGTVPHFKKTDSLLKIFENPKSSIAEAFRAIRTNIRFLSPKDTEIITVTSTISGEGKTTVASNLAAIYSMAGKKTVIINLDMRKPSLHMVFGIENDKGISNVLAKQAGIDEVIHSTKYANLDVIPSGPIPPNPGELIQSEMMDGIIKYLQKKYDIVIFDTPPVGLVVDAISVLTKSDINLYVFRANYSKKEFINNVNDLKYNKKIKGLGIILNDVKSKSSYGYGYGYGYGYYSEEK